MDNFKVDLYIRVSTERQANEGDSLDEQENELRKFCDYRGYKIHHVFIERGKSGGNTNRPEYQRLVKDILAKKVNAVVVKKLDRLSRSLLDFESLMKTMQEKEIEFISLKESFDTTTAIGKAMLRVALVFAQLEREQTSERLIDVMEYRASQGMYNGGHRPFGYTNVDKQIAPHKREKEIVVLMFDKYIETKSTIQTARFLNDTGYRDRDNKLFDNRKIHRIIQNSVYTGKIIWNGKLYDGLHQPIIAEAKFNQVQKIIEESNYKVRPNQVQGLLKKLLFCGSCSSYMTPSHSLNRMKNKFYYYRCRSTCNPEKGQHNCTIKNAPFALVDTRVKEILLELSQETQFKLLENRILKHNQSVEREEQSMQKEKLLLENELESVREKKDKYLDSLISSQFLSKERERINQKIGELELEEKQIKARIYKLEFNICEVLDTVIDVSLLKKRLISFKTNHESYTFDHLQEYLVSMVEKIIYHKDRLLIYFKLLPWELEFELNKD